MRITKLSDNKRTFETTAQGNRFGEKGRVNNTGADPGFLLGGGCTRLLLYFNTNEPNSFFFRRIPVVLEKRRSSQGGGGVHVPPAPSP